MKSFLKLGSLFALIIAGRYMQSVAPVGAGMQQKAPLALFAPTQPTLTHYVGYGTQPLPVLPASQRNPRKQPVITWY